MKRNVLLLLIALTCLLIFAGCSDPVIKSGGGDDTWEEPPANEDWNDDFVPGGIPFPTQEELDDLGNVRVVTIDARAGQEYQTITGGFGAWGGFEAHQIGLWDNQAIEEMYDLLFSQEFDEDGHPKGAGISLWGMMVGAGGMDQIKKGDDTKTMGTPADYTKNGHWEKNQWCYLRDIDKPYTNKSWTDTNNPPPDFQLDLDFSKDMGNQNFIREGTERGLVNIMAHSSSPVVAWTLNGKSWADTATAFNLKANHYVTYARYLCDVAEHFKSEGYNVKYLSPLNEPNNDWTRATQEGTSARPAEMYKMYKALDDEIKKNAALKGWAKIHPFHTSYWYELCSDVAGGADTNKMFYNFYRTADPGMYIGDFESMNPWEISGHDYITDTNNTAIIAARKTVRSEANRYHTNAGKTGEPEIWATEWCGVDNIFGTMSYYDFAMHQAKLIYCGMTTGKFSSWVFWVAASGEGSSKNRYALIAIQPGKTIYDNNWVNAPPMSTNGTYKQMPNLWTLGNYSLFIRPGFKRIDLKGTTAAPFDDIEKFMGSAYKSPAGFTDFTDKKGTKTQVDRIVAVYVNWSKESRNIVAKFTGKGNPTRIRCYVTRTSHFDHTGKGNGLRREGHVNGVFQIPPRSVVTMVYDFHTPD